MKRWILVGLVAVVGVTPASVSFAGERVKGRWEGLALGLGSVTVYNLFEHGVFSPVLAPHRAYARHLDRHPPVVHEPSGHWEIHREWIPEREEHIWVPGHYENGYWVEDHDEVLIHPGYYEEVKVWVEDPHYEPGSLSKQGPPPWAPAHGRRAKYRYYYYPSHHVYYDVGRGVYFYLAGDGWRVSVHLPPGIHLGYADHVALELETDKPYGYFSEHKKKYPPGQLKKNKHKKK